ncbi:hypothetical protein HZH66_003464 [Vespula vulgaris]|uniref:Uncharacterized protein n=1 Tax=Vespula vulgaris TaxID=7454 RepID=A0A834KD71_VESVU|nr:hypothetical protein HZH66_003464 [Vespula vulgaris]
MHARACHERREVRVVSPTSQAGQQPAMVPILRYVQIARYNVANVLWEQQGATCRKAKATSSISRNNVTGHIQSRFNDAVSRYSEWIQIDRICELEFRIE